MSSDNGIFILQTQGPEFRVAYGHTIDNIYGKFNDETAHWDGDSESILAFFGDALVHQYLEEALDAAQKISHTMEETEYGICIINTFKERKFPC